MSAGNTCVAPCFNIGNQSKLSDIYALAYVVAGGFSALSVVAISKELENGKVNKKFLKFFSAWGFLLIGLSIATLLFVLMNFSYFKRKQGLQFTFGLILQSILNIVFASMGLVMTNKVAENPTANIDTLKSFSLHIDPVFWVMAILNGFSGLGMIYLLFTSKKDFRGGATKGLKSAATAMTAGSARGFF